MSEYPSHRGVRRKGRPPTQRARGGGYAGLFIAWFPSCFFFPLSCSATVSYSVGLFTPTQSPAFRYGKKKNKRHTAQINKSRENMILPLSSPPSHKTRAKGDTGGHKRIKRKNGAVTKGVRSRRVGVWGCATLDRKAQKEEHSRIESGRDGRAQQSNRTRIITPLLFLPGAAVRPPRGEEPRGAHKSLLTRCCFVWRKVDVSRQ